MADRPTHFSATETPCLCGYLERAAEDPDVPIVFDRRVGEYQFRYPQADDGQAMLVIYHCPFCGGAAPRSQREQLFHAISDAEEQRLVELLKPLRTVAAVLQAFGPADDDNPTGESTHGEGCDGKPPSITYNRTLRYHKLTDVADVMFYEHPDGSVSFSLQGKAIGGS